MVCIGSRRGVGGVLQLTKQIFRTTSSLHPAISISYTQPDDSVDVLNCCYIFVVSFIESIHITMLLQLLQKYTCEIYFCAHEWLHFQSLMRFMSYLWNFASVYELLVY